MRVLLDTNIILDVLLNRAPWVTEAKAVWQAHEDGRITGYMATKGSWRISRGAIESSSINSLLPKSSANC